VRGLRAIGYALAGLALVACRDEAHPAPGAPAPLPFSSPGAIPDAPVNGRIHGAPFTLRDARYVIDRRIGYAHTDILLSAGTAEAACAPVAPAQSTAVWLRLDGADKIASTSTRVGPGADGTWQVHYQAFDDGRWVGAGEGTALLVVREPGPDGRLSGGIAVCFPDATKSCVSGSFEAIGCPPSIDQAVRGTPPPEAIPPQYLQKVTAAGSAPSPSK
jgi:hypothetical protein